MRDGASQRTGIGADPWASRPEANPGRSPRVLVLADDELNIRAYKEILGGEGFEVVALADRGSLAAHLGRNPLDLVVNDIALPQMDGLNVLRTVQQFDPDLPVVFVTAKQMAESAVHVIDPGVLHYLIKPVDRKHLIATVNHAVRLRRIAAIERLAFELYGRPTREDSNRSDLDARFSRAIETLWMAYQPIVQCSRKAIVAYEALVRTDEQSLMRPYDLFQAAEMLKRLDQLGRAIRRAVASSHNRLPKNVDVFVNLRAEDLNDEELFAPQAPLSQMAERVVLEINERQPLTEVPRVRFRIASLRHMGYRIAIDDLGAGRSGLSALARMQPDVVKLDMSLVRQIGSDPMKQRIVGAMIQACADLGITVIPEGVEEREERDTLISLGGDLMQGYLFGKPSGILPQSSGSRAFK